MINTIDFDFIDVANSWEGYSTSEIIDIILKPEAFNSDFIAEALREGYKRSGLFHILALVKSSTNIESLAIQKFLIITEIIGISIAGYSLPLIRKNKLSILEGALCMMALSVSYALNHEWGNWGLIFNGRIYILPYCAWIVALILAKRKNYLGSGFCLFFACLYHPLLGLLGTVSASYYAASRKRFWPNVITKDSVLESIAKTSKVALPSILYIAIITLFINDLPSELKVSAENFVHWAKATNVHWFPWTSQLLKSNSSFLIPYASMTVSAIALEILIVKNKYAQKRRIDTLITPILLISITAVAGVLATETLLEPTIIKLAIFRITGFGIILTMPILISAFANAITEGAEASDFKTNFCNLMAMAVSTMYLIACFTKTYLWPWILGISIALISIEAARSLQGRMDKLKLRTTLAVTIFLIAITIISLGHLDSGRDQIGIAISAMLDGKTSLILVISLLASALIYLTIRSSNGNAIRYRLAQWGIIFGWVLLAPKGLGIENMYQEIFVYGKTSNVSIQKDYYEIQTCAEKKTSSDAVVMPPLDRAYGWRSKSQRMSTGSARDWSMAWIYTSNKDTFNEGKKRLSILGMQKWMKLDFSLEGHNGIYRFIDSLNNILNKMSPDDLNILSKKIGATHFVVDKNRHKHPLIEDSVVCENDSYVLAKTTGDIIENQ